MLREASWLLERGVDRARGSRRGRARLARPPLGARGPCRVRRASIGVAELAELAGDGADARALQSLAALAGETEPEQAAALRERRDQGLAAALRAARSPPSAPRRRTLSPGRRALRTPARGAARACRAAAIEMPPSVLRLSPLQRGRRTRDGPSGWQEGSGVPKLGMGPIRRQQICRAAAAVVAREGFAGTTMRMVAEEAGVSTGMLNHYFANRADLLTQALVYVSERSQERYERAIEGIAAGRRAPGSAARQRARRRRGVDRDLARLDQRDRRGGAPAGAAAHDRGAPRTVVRAGRRRARGARRGPSSPPAIPWAWRVDALLTGSRSGPDLRSRARTASGSATRSCGWCSRAPGRTRSRSRAGGARRSPQRAGAPAGAARLPRRCAPSPSRPPARSPSRSAPSPSCSTAATRSCASRRPACAARTCTSTTAASRSSRASRSATSTSARSSAAGDGVTPRRRRRPRARLLPHRLRRMLVLPPRPLPPLRALAHLRPRRDARLAAGHPGRDGADPERRPRAAQGARGHEQRRRAVRRRRDGHRLPRGGGERDAPRRRRRRARPRTGRPVRRAGRAGRAGRPRDRDRHGRPNGSRSPRRSAPRRSTSPSRTRKPPSPRRPKAAASMSRSTRSETRARSRPRSGSPAPAAACSASASTPSAPRSTWACCG